MDGTAEVTDFEILLEHENVLGFDVAVDDLLFVHVAQALAYLAQAAGGL